MRTIRLLTSNLYQTATRAPPLQCRQPFLAGSTLRPTNHERQNQQRRPFFSNPLSTPQTITATRILRYPAHVIYEVISDVGSYHSFIPYCHSSTVTKTSEPADNGKKYPEEAKLVIGFTPDMSEEFWSRVYCVPERVVEAVSGSSNTTLSAEEIAHHHTRPAGTEDNTQNANIMSQLLTRWTLRP